METFLDARRHIDADAYPNLARLAGDATVYRDFTAAGDETTRVTSSLFDRHAMGPAQAQAADRARAPAQPLHAARRRLPHARVRGGERPLPAAHLPQPRLARGGLGDLLRDAAIVYEHVVAPPAIRTISLPPTRRSVRTPTTAGASAATSCCTTSAAGGARRATPTGSSRSTPAAGRRSTSSTCCCRTSRGNTCRTAGATRPTRTGTSTAAPTSARSATAGCSSRPTSATYCRPAIPTRCRPLLDRLRKKGIYDRALVVIPADNSESFLKLGHNRHIADAATAADIASTPLLIKLPGQHRGRYSDLHVRAIDLLPTIADALDVRIPWPVDGRSFLRWTTTRPAGRVFPRAQARRHVQMSLAEYERDGRRRWRPSSGFSATASTRSGHSPSCVGRAPAAAARHRCGRRSTSRNGSRTSTRGHRSSRRTSRGDSPARALGPVSRWPSRSMTASSRRAGARNSRAPTTCSSRS